MPESPSAILQPALIFLGSGSGGLLRYWLGGLIQSWCGPHFPFGTLAVNVSGCLAMGFLMVFWSGPGAIREEYRAAVLIGLLGGYTTFSSFGRDTFLLAQGGDWPRALAYVFGSVLLSLIAVWAGASVGGKLI